MTGLRPVVGADLDRLRSGWRSLCAAGAAADDRFQLPDAAWPARRAAAAEALREPGSTSWLLEADGAVHGFLLGAAERTALRGPRVAVVHDLWIAPERRGQGLGRALVERWRDAATAAGFGAFEVGTLARDAGAVAFWGRMGFGPWRVVLRDG